LSKLGRLEPFFLALLAGGLAILGGYLASREAFRGERALREDQREADTRAAARVLDLELLNRLRLTLTPFGVALPRGDIKAEAVQAEWDCVLDAFDERLTSSRVAPARCLRRAQPPNDATRLKPIAWSPSDRHLLAARIRGDRWFRITAAADWWAMITETTPTVRSLVRQTRAAERAAATVAEGARRLAGARLALSPYVGSDR
jgi:hypothetical protein